MCSKLLVIGIDGGDPDLVQKWQEDLPNLRRLTKTGASGPLRSSEPPLTVPAWYVFATGKEPGNLGIFGFARRLPESYRFTFANLAGCRSKTLWDHVGEAGLRVGVFNVPGTYPPQPVNGFAVCSSISAPPNDGKLEFAYPQGLSRKLDRLTGGYELASMKPVERDNERLMIEERWRVHRKQANALFHLASTETWDALIAVFDITDRIGHQMWKHMDPAHTQHDPVRSLAYKDALRDAYVAVDQEIGRLVGLAGDDAVVMVMSDHGFGPQERTFRVDEWLQQEGFLSVAQDYGPSRRPVVGQLSDLLVLLNDQSSRFRRLTKPFRGSTLARSIRAEHGRQQRDVPLHSVSIDWKRTLAYSFNQNAIRVNLEGREPQGAVQAGEDYDVLVEELMDRLMAVRDPVTGQQAVSRVLGRREVYQGDYLDEAPDVLVFMEDIHCPVVPSFSSDGAFDRNPLGSGHHRPYGLLIVSGPDIHQVELTEVGLADLMPTVLHLLDLPIPDDLDGRVLMELFAPDSGPAIRPLRLVPAEEATVPDFAYSETEEQAISEHLEGLGYL